MPPRRKETRSGRFVPQGEGYSAFVPKPLPPAPSIDLDPGLLALLEQSGTELGRLDGIARAIPDPDFFVSMYVRREAVLSSQIEGTQSTLEDLLEREIGAGADDHRSDVLDIVNYVQAMNFGLERLQTLPLSLRLIREIHRELLKDGRGSHAAPGEFRKTQNWIGPDGATIEQATFVPPPVPEMKKALDQLESFLHEESPHSTLIEVSLAHAQFETIHPFLDGNGRVGRLLNTFLLVQRGVLRKPLLYLSYYFKLHRTEYYDRLMAVRLNGDWEGWLAFFLRGVVQTAREATTTAEQIFELRENHRTAIIERGLGENSLRLLSELFRRPLLNVNLAAEALGTTYPTASRLVSGFEELGILEEITGRKRSRIYRYEPYVSLFDDAPVPDQERTPPEVTEA
ncbi:MAG: Fic family protein [Actinobacteria bacterium]|nr:Fic family protein [Actinomycetota bacterium]